MYHSVVCSGSFCYTTVHDSAIQSWSLLGTQEAVREHACMTQSDTAGCQAAKVRDAWVLGVAGTADILTNPLTLWMLAAPLVVVRCNTQQCGVEQEHWTVAG